MAKKQRRFEQLNSMAAATAAEEAKPKVQYRDPFQEKMGKGVDSFGQLIEGKGKTILYAIGALILIAIIALMVRSWMNKSGGEAQAELGKAIATSTAQVTDTPPAPGSQEKTFKTERERAEAAITEFQAVADKFGGAVGEKAKYFIAVNKLDTDRAAGIADLETISRSSGENGTLAKFALAQTRFEDQKYDDAAALYSELAASSDPILAKDTINFELAQTYEKQNKKQEAVELYYAIAKAAADAKTPDGDPAPQTDTSRKAKTKVEELDPAKAKDLPSAAQSNPGSPFGS